MEARDHAKQPDAGRVRPAPSRSAEAGEGTPVPGLLALQRTAGNAAIVQLLAEADHSWAQEHHQHGAGCGHQQAEESPVQRSAVPDVLRAPGRPLDGAVRADMEARLGADFTGVRIHDDTAAKASAAEVGARAYTSGSHIVIGDGGADRHTLAHELTHVIQQRQGPVAGTDNGSGLSVSDPSDRFEREAEANATRVLSGPAPAERADGEPRGPQSGPADGGGRIQRQVAVPLDAYQRGVDPEGNGLTVAQLKNYFRMTVDSELQVALGQLGSKNQRAVQEKYDAVTAYLKTTDDATVVPEGELTQARQVVNAVRKFVAKSGVPSRSDRYNVKPQAPYEHAEGVTWANDEEMWSSFGPGFGALHDAGALTETAPRESRQKPVSRLTWAQATALLPQPLLKLLFDVRFQLDTVATEATENTPAVPKTVVDERTDDEKARQVKSPTEPGTLRSWHQDSQGLLPSSTVPRPTQQEKRKLGKEATREQAVEDYKGVVAKSVPESGADLHAHYSKNSQSGAGSNIDPDAPPVPTGLAEYTGTGSRGEHNTKVVLDYVQKRVYLTLTHYQYWILQGTGDEAQFVTTGTSEMGEALGRMADVQRDAEPDTPLKLMSPWLEILVA
ncbi:DUF4157 domain-containing protein [Streptomyces sp. NPDC059002]|uniref:eCIS core domain-containing protein n=1 Tax=Streptomyces sp. NPDC059002 TaxID=3346690 RepID=UPI00367D0778